MATPPKAEALTTILGVFAGNVRNRSPRRRQLRLRDPPSVENFTDDAASDYGGEVLRPMSEPEADAVEGGRRVRKIKTTTTTNILVVKDGESGSPDARASEGEMAGGEDGGGEKSGEKRGESLAEINDGGSTSLEKKQPQEPVIEQRLTPVMGLKAKHIVAR